MRSNSGMATKKRILIVEDNDDYRYLLVIFLSREGYEVVEARTGSEAIEQVHATHPDLIIMDLALPGITGDEALARLKADPSTRKIPIVVATAFHEAAARVERVVAAGADEILHKPITWTTIQEVMSRYLSEDSRHSRSDSTSSPQS
jgi:CheY-like chemotaxis protein